MSSGSTAYPTSLPTSRLDRGEYYHCALTLLEKTGRIGEGHYFLPALYYQHSVRKDVEFLRYLMAVVYVESQFHPRAISPAGAHGLTQMMRVAVTDSERYCSLRPVRDMSELLDSATAIRYGSCYLDKLVTETGGNWRRALVAYNGGYSALTRYDRGESIPTETRNYVKRVEQALADCSRQDGERLAWED